MLFSLLIFHFGIQMSNALERLLLHPLAVIAHILGQPSGAAPAARQRRRAGMYWRLHSEFGRYLDHGLVYHDRHRVQVVGMGLQPQPLCLQGDGPASGKGIQQSGRVAAGGLHDLGLGCVQHLRVVGVLPHHQLFQNAEQTLPLGVLLLLSGELLRVAGRVVHQAGPDHRPRRRQRTPRPPQVQSGRVTVADGFLTGRLLVDGLQGEGYFNQFFKHSHYLSNMIVAPLTNSAMS